MTEDLIKHEELINAWLCSQIMRRASAGGCEYIASTHGTEHQDTKAGAVPEEEAELCVQRGKLTRSSRGPEHRRLHFNVKNETYRYYRGHNSERNLHGFCIGSLTFRYGA